MPSRSTTSPRRTSSRSCARSTPVGLGRRDARRPQRGDERVVGERVVARSAGRARPPSMHDVRRAWRPPRARARRARPGRGPVAPAAATRCVAPRVGDAASAAGATTHRSERRRAPLAGRAPRARRRRPSRARRPPGRRRGRAGPSTPAARAPRRAPRRRRRSRRGPTRAARTGRPAAAAARCARCSRTRPAAPGAMASGPSTRTRHRALAGADVGEVRTAPRHLVVERRQHVERWRRTVAWAATAPAHDHGVAALQIWCGRRRQVQRHAVAGPIDVDARSPCDWMRRGCGTACRPARCRLGRRRAACRR